MRSAERVVFAFRAAGEAGKTAALADRADAIAAAGEYLVRIGLVADVPDDAVVRRVEDVVQSGGELDHAETGAKMAAADGHRIDQLVAQLVSELAQLRFVELLQISGMDNGIEKRGLGHQD